MKAKLHHLIKSEGLTASRFAEMLEIQPAGVSHILAGRNKPSFDLLQKILRRFPKINPDWLLLDSEQMYRDGWNEAGEAMASLGANGSTFGNGSGAPFGSGDHFGSGVAGGSGDLFGAGVNEAGRSGAGGALGFGGSNFGGQNLDRGSIGSGANDSVGVGSANFGGDGRVSGHGAVGNTNFGVNGGEALGSQNLPFGEGNISGREGYPPHLLNSRAGQPIQKIVIFYADGTFEAYSHGF